MLSRNTKPHQSGDILVEVIVIQCLTLRGNFVKIVRLGQVLRGGWQWQGGLGPRAGRNLFPSLPRGGRRQGELALYLTAMSSTRLKLVILRTLMRCTRDVRRLTWEGCRGMSWRLSSSPHSGLLSSPGYWRLSHASHLLRNINFSAFIILIFQNMFLD